jgi:hypothetical protein
VSHNGRGQCPRTKRTDTWTHPTARPLRQGTANLKRPVEVAMLRCRIKRRPERLRDSLSESDFIQCGNVYAGGCNHFGLVNRNIGHGKARDYLPITGDKTRRPSFIVVRP